MTNYESMDTKLKDGNWFLSMTTVDENSGHTYKTTLYIMTSHYELKAVFEKTDQLAFPAPLAVSIFCQANIKEMNEREFIEYLTSRFSALSELHSMQMRHDATH